MDDMDPELLDFLHDKVNSFIKWDMVRFFHDNPHAADTADNIARYTGRDVRTIADELVGLVEVGVLEQTELSGQTIYMLTSDESMRDLIRTFVLACDDRMFRVKAIYHVIRGMR
jgi:predicted transcriptional regulator